MKKLILPAIMLVLSLVLFYVDAVELENGTRSSLWLLSSVLWTMVVFDIKKEDKLNQMEETIDLIWEHLIDTKCYGTIINKLNDIEECLTDNFKNMVRHKYLNDEEMEWQKNALEE